MSYESRNQIFRDGYNALGLFFPNFLPGRIRNEQIYDMFGGFKMERIPNLLRSHINLKSSKGYSSNSFRFGNIPFRKDSQSTSVSPSFNFGTSRNAVSRIGSPFHNTASTFGNVPQNAGSAFRIQSNGDIMGLSSMPRSKGLFGSSNDAGNVVSSGNSMPSNQPTGSLLRISNNPSGTTFGKANHK